MTSLLQRAMEDSESAPDASSQAAILLKGPLAEVYTQALYLTHGKQAKTPEAPDATPTPAEGDKPSEEVAAAMETIQMDSVMLDHMSKLINPTTGGAEGPPPQSVYAVSKRGVDNQTVVDLTRELAAHQADDRRGDFIFIIDATTPGKNSEEGTVRERVLRIGAALEAMCEAHGVPVYESLGAYLQTRA